MLYKHTKPWFMTMACVLLVSSGAFGQRAYLVVDRNTGAAEAVSSADIPVDGYSITSASGLLNAEGWSSLQDQGASGWTEANPNANQLTELSLENGGLAAGEAVGIGSPFSAGMAKLPSEEDLGFQISVPGTGGEVGTVVNGYVVYTGDSMAPTITVNRESGNIQLTNPAGFSVDGISIGSASGLLDPAGLASVDGFTVANPTNTLVTTLSLGGAAEFPGNVDLGSVFKPGGIVGINDEDLTFQYTRPDSLEAHTGVVNYTGAVNDLVLQVNEITGVATIQHASPNVAALDVTGYSVLSSSGGIDAAAWQKIGGDFTAANPLETGVAELNLGGAMTFAQGSSHSLGSIFAGSARDLVFEYSTPGVDKALGSVQYVMGADSGPTCVDIGASRVVQGDLDGNGEVGFPDFLVMSANFGATSGVGYEQGDIDCNGEVAFADFLVLSANFGQTAGANAQSVPEPNAAGMALLAMLVVFSFRRKR